MARNAASFWPSIERLYWVSALGLGGVALGLELLTADRTVVLFGAAYLLLTLAFYQRGRLAMGVHILYSLLSTLLLLWLRPQLTVPSDPSPFLAAILVLALLVAGVYARHWSALAVAVVAFAFPGLEAYQRIGLLGVYALAAYLGVRIRGWLEALSETQARLTWLAHHDPLTGLGNRHALEAALAGASSGLYLSLWDLDNLKRINDEGGHAAGDAALRALAQAFLAEGRADDRFFRTGGDEFVGLHRGSRPPLGLVARVRRRFPGVSVGLAELAGANLDAAIAEADRAMYREKQARAGTRGGSW